MPDNVQETKVELLYEGTEVEDGTVPVEDMIDALTGFSGAYNKIAKTERGLDQGHRIRVVGLEKGSAKIIVEVVDWIIKNPNASLALSGVATTVVGGAYIALRDLAKVIWARKSTRGQPISKNNITFKDNLIVMGDINLTREQYDVLESGEIDNDLERLTRPLETGRGVHRFKLKTGKEELVEVNADERPFFYGSRRSNRDVRSGVWLEGTLNSHSKRNNRGMFHTLDGVHIRYHYIGEDDNPVLTAYAQDGAVRVMGTVVYRDEMPTSIEIREIHPLHDERLPIKKSDS